MTLPGLRVEGRAAQIEQAAADWLERVDADGRPEDPIALDRWLAESPRHRAAYLRLLVAWRHAQALRTLAAEYPEPDADLLEQEVLDPACGTGGFLHDTLNRLRELTARPFARFAVASTVVAFVAVTAWLVMNDGATPRTFSTQVGEFRRFTLEDGSSVALNTDSKVLVRYLPTSRHVDLVKGEALFTVAKSHIRPFDVKAGDTTVRAVGTEFSVRFHDSATSSRVDVVVVEGRIAINPPNSIAFAAGTAATVENGRVLATHLDADDIGNRLAWSTTGRLRFSDESLEDVVAEMNRYNARKIVIASPDVGRLRIGGTFEARNPDALARSVRDVLGVRLGFVNEDSGPGTIVLEAGTP